MSDQPRWSDAIQAATWISSRGRDCEILLLLSQLPLMSAQLICSLTRHQSCASTYRCLTRLRVESLVTAIRPATTRGYSPALHYLTDLGLATAGRLMGVEPSALAREKRLNTTHLQATLAQLPHTLACYELLAFVVAAKPDWPELLRWERPFRRQFRSPSRVSPVTVEMPAYVELGNDADVCSYLLYPDLGTVPLRFARASLDRLAIYQSRPVGIMPILVVATSTSARSDAWERLLDQVAQRRGVEPVSARVLTWQELRGDGGVDEGLLQVPRTWVRRLMPPAHLAPIGPRSRSRTPLPSLVGDRLNLTSTTDRAAAWLGQIALRIGPADFRILDLISRHPFLSLRQLTSVLAVEEPTVRRRRNKLISNGLLRLVGLDEIGSARSGDELLEVTVAGLALVAAHHRLTATAAVRFLGLAGGGPEYPIGQRTSLIRQVEHTYGVNGIFVRFCETAHHLAAAGHDDALVEWRNAAACARGHVRPDAYGVYRHHGHHSGFFLEYDRGTMSARGYAAKFAIYHAYRESGRFGQDYDGFPTILMVTIDDSAEARISRSACAADLGHDPLPLLLTSQPRIDDPCNRNGPLAPIWRQTHAATSERRPWMLQYVQSPKMRNNDRSRSDTLDS